MAKKYDHHVIHGDWIGFFAVVDDDDEQLSCTITTTTGFTAALSLWDC
jgi:hypothetical protein